MSDELEGLNEIRALIHKQQQQILKTKKAWEDGVNSEDDLVRISSKSFLFILQALYDFYRNLESMYISNEAWSKQIDLLKDTIFELKEVKNNPKFQDKINELFGSYNRAFAEQRKSFIETYGTE